MLFNSLSFAAFFPFVTALYFLFPHRHRTLLLLVASCIFYMWFIPKYILILAITILIDYFAAIFIEEATDLVQKKRLLVVSILSTCLVLFVFKYFNFFNSNFSHLARLFGWNYPERTLGIILPIGLSFHTFQSLSYVIEVYRGAQKAERDFLIYSLYVMFYPQLVAGPIERPQNLLHQFREEHVFDSRRAINGVKLMVWGLFKKMVIADRLALVVNHVYDSPRTSHGPQFVIATIFFAFQIYCDFSGYSDIAIGSAQVMGFKLMDNFNRPYFSKSISEFWKRWHISLSTWFRDYLYISLGGNRCAKWRWQLNLFITFVISGLWHGANWTYVIWGAMNGFYLVFSLWTAEFRERLSRWAGLSRAPRLQRIWNVSVTFMLICFSWIFFRANSLRDAVYVIRHLPEGFALHFNLSLEQVGVSPAELVYSIVLVLFLTLVHVFQRHGSIRHMLSERPLVVRWSVYSVLIWTIVFSGKIYAQKFIYFVF